MKSETSPQSPPDVTPAEPHSIFDKRQKAVIVFIAATAATFSGFASNIYFPALPAVASDLHVSVELVNLTITSYLLLQGIAPSFWGPLSDAKGRRITYFWTFLVFLGACIGLANTQNYPTLIVLRSLQSSGSASTIAVGAAVIGDITTLADRGGFMGIFQAGLLAPVAVGPVIGGALAGSSLGWRSIFWFLSIYAGVFLLLLLAFQPETLRSIVANGSARPSGLMTRYPLNLYQRTTRTKFTTPQVAACGTQSKTKAQRINLAGPFRILFSKQAAPVVIFVAVYYTVWQMTITAMADLFQTRYGLSETQIGFAFVANGVGSIIGTLVTGRILDADYRRLLKAKHDHDAASAEPETRRGTGGEESEQQEQQQQPPRPSQYVVDDGFPLEKARLLRVPILALLQCAAVVTFGWTIEFSARVHIAVPIITTFVTGWVVVSIVSVVQTYLIDIFPQQQAAATASVNLARCLLGAGGISIVMPLVNAVGVGWTFTIAVGVMIIAFVALGIQWRYGGKWRVEADEVRRTADEQKEPLE